MKSHGLRLVLRLAVTALALAPWAAFAAAAPGQSASSATYFLLGTGQASGGTCGSATYVLGVAVGGGLAPEPAFSTTYRLVGGVNALADTPVAGQPWLSAAQPAFGPLLGGTVHTLHGHELALGATSQVTIGGRTATVTGRANDRLVVTLPAQAAPGWQPVRVTNGGGTGHLSPHAIGVLPMTEKAHAITPGQPFRLTYRGNPGDLFFFALATGRLPGPLPIGPFHHGLELDPARLIGSVFGPFAVTDPSGLFHFDWPAGIHFPRPLYFQMLGYSATPGYAPASFTNTISL